MHVCRREDREVRRCLDADEITYLFLALGQAVRLEEIVQRVARLHALHVVGHRAAKARTRGYA
jgi:hypothetical protein